MNAILVLNRKAGAAAGSDAEPSDQALQQAFAQAGVSVALLPLEGGEVDRTFAAALARRPDAILAGGGDGTVSAAAGRLADSGVPLGVLPLGTLNHFARDLGLPAGWREAIRTLATAVERRVDVAEVNGRVFINNCSLGSYGEAVRRRDALRRERGHGKWRAMALACWQVFRRLRRHRFTIETPAGTTCLRSPFAVIANNRYSGHVLNSDLRPRLDEGRLWLYTTRAQSRWAVLGLVAQALTRDLDDTDRLDVQDTDRATISVAKPPLPVACDGELVDLAPPLKFRCRPLALRVLAPPAGSRP
ncbi:MAG TPA: diacylglycerol kinase family protein [Opitutus sp.]|nr:diacylglycerol kinase family protein [Opitutus sp.]